MPDIWMGLHICVCMCTWTGEVLFILDKLQSTSVFIHDLFAEICWWVGILGWEN